MKNAIYLARFGKIYGPLEEAELTRMQADGRLKEFSWIWSAGSSAWKPLDPAPAPIAAVPTKERESVRTLEGVREGGGLIEAVCHNGANYLSGRLEFMTETGCEFMSEHAEPYPLFADRNPVWLNLYDAESGRLMNAQARVCAASRAPGGWRYQLRWDVCPRFLKETRVEAG